MGGLWNFYFFIGYAMDSGATIGKLFDAVGTSFNTGFTAMFESLPKLVAYVVPVLTVFLALTYGTQIIGWVKAVFQKMRD